MGFDRPLGLLRLQYQDSAVVHQPLGLEQAVVVLEQYRSEQSEVPKLPIADQLPHFGSDNIRQLQA